MSMVSQEPATSEKPSKVVRWHQHVLGFCLVVFALELGVFLLVFPWLRTWDLSWIPLQSPWLNDIWMSDYFRGALSGLGLLNIYVGVAELVRQIRLLFKN